MLIDWLFTWLIGLLNSMVNLLPEWEWVYSPAEELTNIAAQINQYIGAWVPVPFIMTLLIAYVGAELAYQSVAIVVFAFNRIRGA